MFQDEGRFGRINDPRRCWAPPGVRPQVGAQLIREYSYVFAAVSPHDGTLDSLILPQVDTETMSIFLAEVAARHPQDFILMILDGAGWHKAKRLNIPENIRLIPLPPYSPQLNPTEHLWEEIREKRFTNLVFDSLDAIENHLADALRALEQNPAKVLSLTSFNWIVNCNLIAN